MIFFSIPSVNQPKPELLFGNDDHYGFIKTLIGEEYQREKIKLLCKKYYDKPTDKYWDQIITYANFLAFKKLNEKKQFQDIPILSLVSEEYDKNNDLPAKILFDYFLCQWQYPHPINTTQKIKEKDVELSIDELRRFQISKPYSSILNILLNLYKKDPSQSYLSNDEFYWLGLEFYKSKGGIFQKNNIHNFTDKIFKIRKSGGWKGYKELVNKKIPVKTHLSYPKGFLRNSILLSDEKNLYPNISNLFIGFNLYASKNIKIVKKIISETDKTKFEWERNRSPRDDSLINEYSNYLYSSERINQWLKNIDIYPQHKTLFDDIPNFDREFDEEEYKNLRIESQLKRISVLDKERITRFRTEQNYLRTYLFSNSDRGTCAICHNSYPTKFMTCAHIKKRTDCSDIEMRDKNVVMPACNFGCDSLFEKGYLIVKDGISVKNISDKLITNDLSLYLDKIIGKRCLSWSQDSKKYFKFHENKQK